MTREKTTFGIFAEASGLYFSNFRQFFKYMSFPIWGQIGGLCLIFLITFIYVQNIPKLIEKYPQFNDVGIIALISIVIILPGLLIYLKAFWEYLVAFGAINSMLDNMLKSGRVYDFDAHTQLVKKRSASFIGLWLLLGLFSIVAVLPPFWIICGIFGVYFVLVFQVFTFEEDKTPIACFKRSLQLVLRHFGSTFLLIMLAGILTYYVIPQIFIKIFDITCLTNIMAETVKPLFSNIPVIEIPGVGVITDVQFGIVVVQSLLTQILIQYTLPLRSVLWGLWYKKLSKNSEPALKTEKKASKKRPSEVLMEESHKKYGKKKLDTNIIRRAMEKEEDD